MLEGIIKGLLTNTVQHRFHVDGDVGLQLQLGPNVEAVTGTKRRDKLHEGGHDPLALQYFRTEPESKRAHFTERRLGQRVYVE
jgi:hypothetical protein